MKKLLTFVLSMCFCYNASAQEELIKTFLDETPKRTDTLRFFSEASVLGILSEEKPALYHKNTNQGIVVEEKPKAFRQRFQGSFTFLGYLRRDLSKSFEPYVGIDVNGHFLSYNSVKWILGFTDKSYRTSLGIFAGKYARRIDSDDSDFNYKSFHYEEGTIWGAHFYADPNFISIFGSFGKEERKSYHRFVLDIKVGEMLMSNSGLRHIRIHAESETLLGTGVGLSWKGPHGRFGIGISYIIPDEVERAEQRPLEEYHEKGVVVRLSRRWF